MEKTFTRVAVMCATDLEYPREVIAGVRRFATPDKRWEFQLTSASPAAIEAFKNAPPDGIIAQVSGTHTRDALIEHYPGRVVNVSGRRDDVPFPRVGPDDHQIGRIAADYFLARGYRQFGYYGLDSIPPEAYANRRYEGFVQPIEQTGSHVSSNVTRAALKTWLQGLPKPAAVFAANDSRAVSVCLSCRELGIRVPEDIAVLGVDNDELICALSYPPVSSVAIGAERVGFAAAGLLERLMHGARAPKDPILIPPVGVITRQSSDAQAISDPAVLEAVRFIWQNIDRGINVENVADQLAVSRRWLEHVFHRALRRTPGDEIRRVRMARAQELLVGTDLSMPEIARRVGFRDARRLSVVFRDVLNTTPTAYRRQSRADG